MNDIDWRATAIAVDPAAALLVQGIENWILRLVSMGTSGELVRLKDPETGAIFLVKRES